MTYPETDREPILAIPLWINGHPYLTMAPAFFDVRDAGGEIRRRTPLCGSGEAVAAAASASAALPAWSARPADERARLLGVVGEALAGYAAHFAGLIGEETGKDAALAVVEVAAAVKLLRAAAACSGEAGGVVGIISDDGEPLIGLLRHAVPALSGGATVVVKPSPKAPSAAFALAELTAESGFPGGVFNILHGDLAAVEGLCAADEVSRIRFAGDPALGERVGAIAARYGKRCRD